MRRINYRSERSKGRRTADRTMTKYEELIGLIEENRISNGEEILCCDYCQRIKDGAPETLNDQCEFFDYQDRFLQFGRDAFHGVEGNTNKKVKAARFTCYSHYVRMSSFSPRGHRKPLPVCIEASIKLTFPDKVYTGFIPAPSTPPGPLYPTTEEEDDGSVTASESAFNVPEPQSNQKTAPADIDRGIEYVNRIPKTNDCKIMIRKQLDVSNEKKRRVEVGLVIGTENTPNGKHKKGRTAKDGEAANVCAIYEFEKKQEK